MIPRCSEGLFPSVHSDFFFWGQITRGYHFLKLSSRCFWRNLISLAAQMCQRGADLWVVRAGPSATQHLKRADFSFPAPLMDHRWANVVSLIFNLVYFTSMLTIFRSTLVLSGGLSLPFLRVSVFASCVLELMALKCCPLSGLLLWSIMLQYWLGSLVQSPDVLETESERTVYLNLVRLATEESLTNPKV